MVTDGPTPGPEYGGDPVGADLAGTPRPARDLGQTGRVDHEDREVVGPGPERHGRHRVRAVGIRRVDGVQQRPHRHGADRDHPVGPDECLDLVAPRGGADLGRCRGEGDQADRDDEQRDDTRAAAAPTEVQQGQGCPEPAAAQGPPPPGVDKGIECGSEHEAGGEDDQRRRQEGDAGSWPSPVRTWITAAMASATTTARSGAGAPPPRPRRHTAEQVADRPYQVGPRMATSPAMSAAARATSRGDTASVVTESGPGEPRVARAKSQIPTCPDDVAGDRPGHEAAATISAAASHHWSGLVVPRSFSMPSSTRRAWAVLRGGEVDDKAAEQHKRNRRHRGGLGGLALVSVDAVEQLHDGGDRSRAGHGRGVMEGPLDIAAQRRQLLGGQGRRRAGTR